MIVFFTGTVAFEGNTFPIRNELLDLVVLVLDARFVFPKRRLRISTEDIFPRREYGKH